MYTTKIFLSPITNLADARFAAAAGIDYMGFCFDATHPDFITPIKAKEIIEWTTGSHTVAQFGHQNINEISEITALLNMDVVLLNNNLLPDELAQLEKPIMKILDTDLFDTNELTITIHEYADCVQAFMITGNMQVSKNKEWLVKIMSTNQIIWGLAINSNEVKEIVNTYKPYAICLHAGTEEKTGMKDFDSLYDVLEVLESE